MLYVELEESSEFATFKLSRRGTHYTIKRNVQVRPIVHFRFDYGDDVMITLAIKKGKSVEIKSCFLKSGTED